MTSELDVFDLLNKLKEMDKMLESLKDYHTFPLITDDRLIASSSSDSDEVNPKEASDIPPKPLTEP